MKEIAGDFPLPPSLLSFFLLFFSFLSFEGDRECMEGIPNRVTVRRRDEAPLYGTHCAVSLVWFLDRGAAVALAITQRKAKGHSAALTVQLDVCSQKTCPTETL